MLFSKKKPKLDPKVRFQHKQFTTKLDSARSYKRNARAVPESRVERVLNAFGITARWSQILLGILILGLLYLIYIPNFLSLKQISIAGLSDEQSGQLEQAVRQEIKDSPIYYPEYNLLFLQKDLIYRAVRKVPSIDYVSAIKKDLKGQTIFISATSKYERFLVANPEKVYDVYNDGTFRHEAGVARSDWEQLQNMNMTKVKFSQNFDFQPNSPLFREDLFAYISNLVDGLSIVENQKLAYLGFRELKAEAPPQPTPESVPDSAPTDQPTQPEPQPTPEPKEIPKITLPFSSSEVHAIFYKNNDIRRTYVVIFDATGDARKSLEELKLLLSQTPPERYEQLKYIDLRIPNKAFLCLESAPCAR